MSVDNGFCYHPWSGLEISPQGEFRPCCKYTTSVAKSLAEYQNSSELAEIKTQFLAGQRPAGCEFCWNDEDAGLPSKRQLDNQRLFNDHSIDDPRLKVLSLSFGNSCNLACVICDSYSSSTWITESKKLLGKFPNIKIYDHHRFYQDADFINKIKQASTGLSHVEFPGGEPFLAGLDQHLDFLDFLISCGCENTSLHYMTNATVFPGDQFWSRWSKFKNVDIQLSIDGVESQFEYCRWPAKWTQVQENIQQYISRQQQESNLQLSISHSVSIFNVYYLPEFTRWCLQQGLGRPYLGLVNEPVRYNIKSLPQSVKEKISEKITRFKFENVVSYMYEQDLYDPAEWQFINAVDEIRNLSFTQVFPEFSQLLKEAGCQI